MTVHSWDENPSGVWMLEIQLDDGMDSPGLSVNILLYWFVFTITVVEWMERLLLKW